MTTQTLDIYNLLIDAGIAKDKAEPLAREIVTRSEVRDMLASKEDMKDLRAEMYRALMIQASAIITINTGILALFFSLYG